MVVMWNPEKHAKYPGAAKNPVIENMLLKKGQKPTPSNLFRPNTGTPAPTPTNYGNPAAPAPTVPTTAPAPNPYNPVVGKPTTPAPAAPTNFGAGNNFNQLLYLKTTYEADPKSGKAAWAAQEAAKLYAKLTPEQAAQIKNMNATQLKAWIANEKAKEQALNPVDPGQYAPPVSAAPVADVDFDKYRTETSTIEDIAKKYGFDYSRDYAARQAEAEAQAKRDAGKENLGKVDNYVTGALDGITRNFFQDYLQQQQGQVNTGINGGIAADQDLRLQMAQNAEMAGVYRDANDERFRINNDLGRVELERLAREDSLYNERRQQGFENAMTETQLRQAENLALLDGALNQRGQNIDMSQFNASLLQEKNLAALQAALRNREMSIGQDQFGRQLDFDKFKFNKEMSWDQFQFNRLSAKDKAGLDWEKYMFNNMSAQQRDASKLAWNQLQEEKRQFGSEMAWREHELSVMNQLERQKFEQAKKEFGEEMAWRMHELDVSSQLTREGYAFEAGMGGNQLP